VIDFSRINSYSSMASLNAECVPINKYLLLNIRFQAPIRMGDIYPVVQAEDHCAFHYRS
jgi:hypothetical protein